jgi:hypothetical protein
MKRIVGIAVLVALVLAMVAGDVLAGKNGPQVGTDPQQTQLRDRTCTQTCEHNQDCDGNAIQQQDRTRLNYPEENSWLGALRWLLGME